MSISLEAERNQSDELAVVCAECARLQKLLAQMEIERNYYRKGFIDYERQYGEFRDIDVADLEKNSAGPLSFFESRWKHYMISVKLEWMPHSKDQFEKLRKCAIQVGRFAEFRLLHNEIVASLVDLQKATEVGERLNDTKRQGGEIRIWVHKHLSVKFAVLRHERIAWILNYVAIPDNWPD